MSTKLLKSHIPLGIIFKDEVFMLMDIQKYFEYENGQKTDRLAGYKYEVVDTISFDKISVKVKGQSEPLMPPEQLAERRDNGERIFVEFINGYDKLYNRNFNGRWTVEDSFWADNIRLAETIE